MSDLGALDSFTEHERNEFFEALDCLPFDGLKEIDSEWSELTGALGCRSPTEVQSFASSEMEQLVSDPDMVRGTPPPNRKTRFPPKAFAKTSAPSARAPAPANSPLLPPAWPRADLFGGLPGV